MTLGSRRIFYLAILAVPARMLRPLQGGIDRARDSNAWSEMQKPNHTPRWQAMVFKATNATQLVMLKNVPNANKELVGYPEDFRAASIVFACIEVGNRFR